MQEPSVSFEARVANMKQAVDERLHLLGLPITPNNRLVYLTITEYEMAQLPNLVVDDIVTLRSVRHLIKEARSEIDQ